MTMMIVSCFLEYVTLFASIAPSALLTAPSRVNRRGRGTGVASAGNEFDAVWCAVCVRKALGTLVIRRDSARRETASASRWVLITGRIDVNFMV